jgi:hypothetical protein
MLAAESRKVTERSYPDVKEHEAVRRFIHELPSLSNAEVEDCLRKPACAGRGSAELELLLQPFAEWQDLQRSSPLVELERACARGQQEAGSIHFREEVASITEHETVGSIDPKAALAEAIANCGGEGSALRPVQTVSAKAARKILTPPLQPRGHFLPKPLALPRTVAAETGFVSSALRNASQSHSGLWFHSPMSPPRLSRYSSAPSLPALKNEGRDAMLGKVRPGSATVAVM